ncbi:MAG: LTA synthase family protein [Ruminococcaceae bacterium]|nr:LTA synthase family protein [Oscillospiraceae bacterium]
MTMNTAQTPKKMIQTHRLSSALRWLDERPVRLCFFLALALNFVLECLSQRSVVTPLTHGITQPYLFLLGVLLIFCSLCVCLFVKRRYFALSLVSALWLGLGITNFVMMFYRVTPLSAIDFSLLGSVFSIIGVYLNPVQIVLIGAGFLVVVAALVLLFLRTPKRKPHWRRAAYSTGGSALLAVALIMVGLHTGTLNPSIGNLADAYQEYGFALCFCTSLVDRGIDRPEEYEDQIWELAEELTSKDSTLLHHPRKKNPVILPLQSGQDFTDPNMEDEPLTEQTPTPNVIFLQLESFIDPEQITKYDYSEDPTPTFSRLKGLYPSGYLSVPSIGAGTANTEFEIISGMSLEFFGVGEYPYKTVLRDNTCETVAYNLKELGYSTTAVHNNKATFYDRNEVFAKLGFDRFIALEYMNGVRFNAQSWACDDVLKDIILDTLRTTPQSDLIYTISVQGHGRYPDEPVEGGNGPILVEGESDPIMHSRMEYYVNQIAEMDTFLRELIHALTPLDEPVVLVAYGDHLPAMDLMEEDMENSDLFTTEYVIWSNFDIKAEDRDLQAYQLSAHVMGLLGYDNGVLTEFHQNNADSATYLQELELLEYDMLYGERVVYDGENPYEATEITLGLHPISIRSIGMLGKTMYVFGENFTPYSVVCINGRQRETVFMSPYSLCVTEVDFTEAHSITVEQVSEDQEVLSETERYIIE